MTHPLILAAVDAQLRPHEGTLARLIDYLDAYRAPRALRALVRQELRTYSTGCSQELTEYLRRTVTLRVLAWLERRFATSVPLIRTV